MEYIYNWIYAFITGCSNIWSWLITPIFSIGDFIDISPIYLLVGASLVAGVVRAIL